MLSGGQPAREGGEGEDGQARASDFTHTAAQLAQLRRLFDAL